MPGPRIELATLPTPRAGVTIDDELAMQVEAARLTGLIWDPTYTGKAIVRLHDQIASGGLGPDTDVVFWHTGGGFASRTTCR